MLDQDSDSAASTDTAATTSEAPKRRRAVSRPAGPPAASPFSAVEPAAGPKRKRSAAKQADGQTAPAESGSDAGNRRASKDTTRTGGTSPFAAPLFQAPDTVRAPTAKRSAGTLEADRRDDSGGDESGGDDSRGGGSRGGRSRSNDSDANESGGKESGGKESRGKESRGKESGADEPGADESGGDDSDDAEEGAGTRRRRRRGGRRRRRGDGDGDAADSTSDTDDAEASRDDDGKNGDDSDRGDTSDDKSTGGGGSSRRRRRRRRSGDDSGPATDDPSNTVTKVRERRSAEDEITSVSGSTRLEAKKQRRREGREAGRRRAPIVTEAEFLARRESVKREMVIRQRPSLSQIAVLEDDVLVEHYVAAAEQSSMIGNVYIGRVQNVLPSMEAAFIDIGKGRNGVLYAGEVDWKALGNGKPRKIEEALKSGQTVLVQVTKDPVGHKGARLTSQISLAGRFLVYVPGGQTNGISRKLPDTERNRLKGMLKEIIPDEAGVIIRTAAEGASEEQLNRDVSALTARWDDIEAKAAKPNAPQLLYAEPDLMIKVVRDLFNEDFAKLSVEGDESWEMVEAYVQHVAPDLADRLERRDPDADKDVFASYRIDEQIAKGTDRKVWLPSGGSLIIDRTEAMTVVDVNTGKFTGSGGNLEETVTKNNLEAAEEIVRQLRLRDIGGIIVIDFIDMVLENNRDLVLRRLVECLGRDRTRHQVAEVTSLGLVQMTRKRIGTGLVEAFSETCDHCNGRGLVVHSDPIEPRSRDESPRGRRRGKGRGGEKSADSTAKSEGTEDGSATGSGAKGGDGPSDKPKSGKGSKSKGGKPKDGGPKDGGDDSTGKESNDGSKSKDGKSKKRDAEDGDKDRTGKAGETPVEDAKETAVTVGAVDQSATASSSGRAKPTGRRRSARRAQGEPTPGESPADAAGGGSESTGSPAAEVGGDGAALTSGQVDP